MLPSNWRLRLVLAALAVSSSLAAGPIEGQSPPTTPTGRIAFSQVVYGPNDTIASSLFVFTFATRTTRLVKQVGEGSFNNLAWAPDGLAVTYVRSADSRNWRAQVYGISLDGRQDRALYPSSEHDNYPAWSRDWRLAYMHGPGGGNGGGIWVNGSLFYDAYCALSRPAWSPDGQTLLAVHMTGGMYRINVAERTSSPFVAGAMPEAQIYAPIYSPDGARVAYVKTAGDVPAGQAEIWVVGADGVAPVRLTSGFRDWYPAWSPDAAFIAFERISESSQRAIYLMRADGTELTLLADNGRYPVWAP